MTAEFIRRDLAKSAEVMREVDALAAQGVLKPHSSARCALASGKATGKIMVERMLDPVLKVRSAPRTGERH